MRYLLLFLMMCASVFGVDYTTASGGDFNTAGTWTQAGYPDGADDTATIGAGHTVTIGGDVLCGSITNATTGTMTLNTAVVTSVITADFIPAGTAVLLTINGTGSATITGDIGASGTSQNDIVLFGGAATLVVNGNVTGGVGDTDEGIDFANNVVTLTVNGDVTGGAGNSSDGIAIGSGKGTIVVTGTITGGPVNGVGIINQAVTSTLTAGTLAYVDARTPPIQGEFATYSITTITVNGTAIGGSGGSGRYDGGGRYNQ